MALTPLSPIFFGPLKIGGEIGYIPPPRDFGDMITMHAEGFDGDGES